MEKDFGMCEMCGMRQATVFIKKSVNGLVTEKHLCPHCAQMLQKSQDFDDIFGDVNLFSGLFDMQPAANKMRVCKCGTTEKDVVDNFKFGCAECYETFKDIAQKFVSKLGGKVYAGKEHNALPLNKPTKKSESKVDALKRQLAEAVEKEDFLLANELKQRLSELKEKGDN